MRVTQPMPVSGNEQRATSFGLPSRVTWSVITATAPVWIAPGQADDTVSLTLGFGRRELGGVANGAGVDAYILQPAANRWFTAGASTK